ncbi:MAG: hypothetical protein ACFFFG_11275 [Candidatus Thorarchaeota archaeon]
MVTINWKMKKTTRIFEVLSHQIRFNIVTQLNFRRLSYTELLANFKGTSGSKFAFHLKKLVEAKLIIKHESNYELTEFGLNTLRFIEAYESDQKDYFLPEDEERSFEDNSSVLKPTKYPLAIYTRPEGLPPSVRTFPLYYGKNSEFMTDNYVLSLPNPISLAQHPKDWIKTFISEFNPITKDERSREWLEERLLKLAYGTRGLQDFGLMDASITVPPLESVFSALLHTLLPRGKGGLFATTGMGKSRILLYFASWWARSYRTPVLFVENPSDMKKNEWESLYEILKENIPQIGTESSWLVIIEDLHLASLKTLNYIKKLIADAGSQSWSILIAFTNSLFPSSTQITSEGREYKSSVEYLKKELQPLDISLNLDLNSVWNDWKPYFSEWIKWVALDVLVDLIPWFKKPEELDSEIKYTSPWSMVVSLGFLRSALTNFQKSAVKDFFPLLLYTLISYLYIIRGETNILKSDLFAFLDKALGKKLMELYQNWEEETLYLLSTWTNPTSRLLPPIRYRSISGSLVREPEISCYHVEWAQEVCNSMLSPQSEDILNTTLDIFRTCLPTIYSFWSKFSDDKLPPLTEFLDWLRKNARFELNKVGQLSLVQLNIPIEELKRLGEWTLDETKLSSLNQVQLLNWTFIKRVLSKHQVYG